MGVWPQTGEMATPSTFASVEAESQRKHERATTAEGVESVEALQGQVAELQGAFDRIADALEEIRTDREKRWDEWVTKMEELESTLSDVVARRYESAGGVIPLSGKKMTGTQPDVDYSVGWPAATGDVRLTHNNAPRGWVLIGDRPYYLPRRDYRELEEVLADQYGPSYSPNWFRLPAKSDLTSDPAILDNPNIRFIIRT